MAGTARIKGYGKIFRPISPSAFDQLNSLERALQYLMDNSPYDHSSSGVGVALKFKILLDCKENGFEHVFYDENGRFKVAYLLDDAGGCEIAEDSLHLSLTLRNAFRQLARHYRRPVNYALTAEGKLELQIDEWTEEIEEGEAFVFTLAQKLTRWAHQEERAHPELSSSSWRKDRLSRSLVMFQNHGPRVKTAQCYELEDVQRLLLESERHGDDRHAFVVHITRCLWCGDRFWDLWTRSIAEENDRKAVLQKRTK